MHSVMYEEIACCVFGQDNDLILVPFRGPLGIRLGKVSVVVAARDETSRAGGTGGQEQGTEQGIPG